MHASSFMIAFALSNIFWYAVFQVYSVLADVSFHSDSHTSAVLGENLPKLNYTKKTLEVACQSMFQLSRVRL